MTGPSAGKEQLATAWFHLEGSTARLFQFRRYRHRRRTGPIKAYLKYRCARGKGVNVRIADISIFFIKAYLKYRCARGKGVNVRIADISIF